MKKPILSRRVTKKGLPVKFKEWRGGKILILPTIAV